MKFAAIDFETANRSSNSACAIGIVRVEDGKTIERFYSPIRPPSRHFEFTYVHGLTWADVCDAPSFKDLWPKIWETIADVDFLVAHNAKFDTQVLRSCCLDARIDTRDLEAIPFICTVAIARKDLKISPAKLSNVCRVLNIDLNHHHALSDALACSQILLKSQEIMGCEYA